MELRNKFTKFNGENVGDIIEYILGVIKEYPDTTISVGCDSSLGRKSTSYVVAIMLYSNSFKKGAHVIYYRENIERIKNTFDRLQREAIYSKEIADFLHDNLKDAYIRKDLNSEERKRYKFHLLRCNGQYEGLEYHTEEVIRNSLFLSEEDLNKEYKLIDIHLDYNITEGSKDKRGNPKNKSYLAFKALSPWLRGLDFRVFCKPQSFCSSCAADALIKI